MRQLFTTGCRSTVLSALACATAITVAPTVASAQPPGIVSSVSGANSDIYYGFSLTTHEKLVASVRFTDTSQKPKVTFVPQTWAASTRTLVNTLTLNFSQDTGVSTFGAGLTFGNSLGYNKRADDLWQGLRKKGLVPPPFRGQHTQGETNEEYAVLSKDYNDVAFNTVNDLYYAAMAKNALTFVIGTNASTFSVVAGEEVDLDEDGVIDNDYQLKGVTHTAALTWTFDQFSVLNVSGYFGRRRNEAKAGSALNSYPGWSLSVARSLKVFDADYKSSSDYREFGFIPALLGGLSVEQQRCLGAAGCEKNLRSQFVITLFADVKLTPTSQFRLGVPIQRFNLIGSKTKTDLGIAVQLAMQLRNLL